MAVSSDKNAKEEILKLLMLDMEQNIDIKRYDSSDCLPGVSLQKFHDILIPSNSGNGCFDDHDIFYEHVRFSFVQLEENSIENGTMISSWGKSLTLLPPFTIKEIEEHRLCSGKTPESAIIKTLDKGRKFKSERYISADSVYTQCDGVYFFVKCECKASMKKEKRKVLVKLKRDNGKVESGSCSCPAGNSGYCNHIMALLLEIADYSLNQLSTVPEEISCTSRMRQWGVSGEHSRPKSPVMETVVKKIFQKKECHQPFLTLEKYKHLMLND